MVQEKRVQMSASKGWMSFGAKECLRKWTLPVWSPYSVLMVAVEKSPSDVGSKMGTATVFLEGWLHMQFTYPTA